MGKERWNGSSRSKKEESRPTYCGAHGSNMLQCTYNESLDGPVVRVHHELCQGAELCSAVPPVAAVDKRAAAALVHAASNEHGSLWNMQHVQCHQS